MGPVPWGVSLLVDMGASVTRVCRPDAGPIHDGAVRGSLSERGRRSISIDMKTLAGVSHALELAETHDVLIEGMRPGVMERLGIGPAACAVVNPRLVYVRVTGWGQGGPLASSAGHDINYIALAGVLHAIGRQGGPPVPPLNLVGDYGGGGAFLVIGVLGALLKASATGCGSVVDVSMLDCAVKQIAAVRERLNRGDWIDERGVNEFDGGAPWYSVYRARCGGYLAVGAIEPKFYREFVRGLGLDEATIPDRADRSRWGALRSLFAARVLTQTRTQWMEVFGALDACVTPVLSLREAPYHSHNRARQVFAEVAEGGFVAGNAPRFLPLPLPFDDSHNFRR